MPWLGSWDGAQHVPSRGLMSHPHDNFYPSAPPSGTTLSTSTSVLVSPLPERQRKTKALICNVLSFSMLEIVPFRHISSSLCDIPEHGIGRRYGKLSLASQGRLALMPHWFSLGPREGKTLLVSPLGCTWAVTFPKSHDVMACWREVTWPCTSPAMYLSS